ncbi:MAG: hypothetical protein BroJett003_19670 [Planctomycetota bacterium]|nr:MAG: hypothetical protein BroJett003_19670 [Planctomycetota bacterium]
MSTAPARITVPSFLQQVLDEFDAKAEDFHEYDLAGAIDLAAKARKPLSDDDWCGYTAEGWAFFFDHSQPGEKSVWGTHFGPVMIAKLKDGSTVYKPDLQQIHAATIAHWQQRQNQVRHPVMRARYADLLWDLRKHVTGHRGEVNDARTAIESYVEASQSASPDYTIDNVHRLMRALELAVSINDTQCVGEVRDAMFTLYDKVVDPAQGGSWPWLFDNLYDNDKVPLTDEQPRHIIDSLENVLKCCTNPEQNESFSPWSAEAAAQRLAVHYAKVNRPEDVRRVVRAYGEAFIHLARQAMGIVSIGWLQQVHDVYRRYGMHAEADQVLLLYKEKGEEAEGQMARIRVDVPVDKEAVDKALDELTSRDAESALASIATAFLPSASRAQGLLNRLHDGGSSIMAHFGVRILGDQQILADVGSLADDLDGRVILQLSQEMDVRWRFLALALDRTYAKFSVGTDGVLDFVRPSALFDPLREPLLRQGLDAYFRNDHVKAIHVLLPQIEAMLRRLLGYLGQPTSKRMRSPKGVMQEKTLTDILEHEPAVAAFFKENELEDWHVYLRMLLTDPRGWNLRNRLAHGLMTPHEFTRQVSDWVIHVVLLLGLLRGEEAERGADGTENGGAAQGESCC